MLDSPASVKPQGAGGARPENEGAALRDLLHSMWLIRTFEEHLLTLPECGFQLLSSGEEAVSVGICHALARGDQLLSSGRSIGPALARGVSPFDLFAELMGRRTGPCKGRAGRGHVSQPSVGFFGAHAVVGGNLSVAAGVALAQQQRHTGGVVVCLFGDGACGAGILHETMNLASLWKLPLVFACNNNQYSVSTRTESVLAVRALVDLATPYRIPARRVDGMDVLEVKQATQEAVRRARGAEGPTFLEFLSYRFHPHSTSTRESRPPAEMATWRKKCPIENFARRFGLDSPAAQERSRQEVSAAVMMARAAPLPSPNDALDQADG
jgi:TPP-dependent pyruvate/acetoin dehydrogenase alpha subunit